jgi:hypothetical protein
MIDDRDTDRAKEAKIILIFGKRELGRPKAIRYEASLGEGFEPFPFLPPSSLLP